MIEENRFRFTFIFLFFVTCLIVLSGCGLSEANPTVDSHNLGINEINEINSQYVNFQNSEYNALILKCKFSSDINLDSLMNDGELKTASQLVQYFARWERGESLEIVPVNQYELSSEKLTKQLDGIIAGRVKMLKVAFSHLRYIYSPPMLDDLERYTCVQELKGNRFIVCSDKKSNKSMTTAFDADNKIQNISVYVETETQLRSSKLEFVDINNQYRLSEAHVKSYQSNHDEEIRLILEYDQKNVYVPTSISIYAYEPKVGKVMEQITITLEGAE
jgi:hypothetical protein